MTPEVGTYSPDETRPSIRDELAGASAEKKLMLTVASSEAGNRHW
jgi:hypothetical protein